MNRLLNRYTFLILVCCMFSLSSIQAQKQGKITVHSSEKIKSVIAKKLSFNKNVKEVPGFRIQLFYGSEDGAKKTGEDFLTLFPEGQTKLKFDSPDWKVMVGNYKSRLDADRALVEIKEAFVSAIIVPEMIDVDREPKKE